MTFYSADNSMSANDVLVNTQSCLQFGGEIWPNSWSKIKIPLILNLFATIIVLNIIYMSKHALEFWNVHSIITLLLLLLLLLFTFR